MVTKYIFCLFAYYAFTSQANTMTKEQIIYKSTKTIGQRALHIGQ